MDFYELKYAIIRSPAFESRAEIWHRYLRDLHPEDVCLEFGVWRGNSINYMANVRPRNAFFGFDSFEGLPVAWDASHPAGHFKVVDRSALKFLPNISLEEGTFEESLPKFMGKVEHLARRITRIHVDCDIYTSTACVLSHMEGIIMSNNPLILFDEFYNYFGFEDHEFKAFLEFVNRTGVTFDVVGHNRRHQQCLIAIK